MTTLAEHLARAERIVVLCGAGISTSAGIPDFRSSSGLFAKYGQEVFHLSAFYRDPQPFYQFYREFSGTEYEPTPTHHFLRRLQDAGKLMRIYTQNIDGLELKAGVDPERVVQVHGHMRTANCARCHKHEIDIATFNELVGLGVKVACPRCQGAGGAYLKPDIVFYGEGLPSSFRKCIETDLNIGGFDLTGRATRGYKEGPFADLLLVMGTSLQVAPVNYLAHNFLGPRIFINSERLLVEEQYRDVHLLGNCDEIVGSN